MRSAECGMRNVKGSVMRRTTLPFNSAFRIPHSALCQIGHRDTQRTVRAPRGPNRTCKGWVQEAALRMLMNNLDPDVAERPQDLVVYGGTGKAARDWPAFDAICRTLLTLA